MKSNLAEDLQRRTWLLRVAIYCVVVASIFAWTRTAPTTVRAQAPAERLEEPPALAPLATEPVDEAVDNVPDTLWEMYVASGLIGYIITVLSVIALGFIVEHFLTINKAKVMPDRVVDDLDGMLRAGQLDAALEYCADGQNASLFASVVHAGIERYRGSEFGFAEYKAAVEEAGEEQTSQMYRKTEVLGVIGAIAPMLGLLGTVQGMILGFNLIASSKGKAGPGDLASSISLALVTTFEGLVVAIPAMVAFSYFRNRIDSLVAEAGKKVEQVLAPLGRRRA